MPRRAVTLLSALLLVGLTACDDEDSTYAAKEKSANAAASPAAVSQHDPCSFLTAGEVERVLGPLAGPPYRAGAEATPQDSGDDCRYEALDRRSIRVPPRRFTRRGPSTARGPQWHPSTPCQLSRSGFYNVSTEPPYSAGWDIDRGVIAI